MLYPLHNHAFDKNTLSQLNSLITRSSLCLLRKYLSFGRIFMNIIKNISKYFARLFKDFLLSLASCQVSFPGNNQISILKQKQQQQSTVCFDRSYDSGLSRPLIISRSRMFNNNVSITPSA